jgi:hypothetical protein
MNLKTFFLTFPFVLLTGCGSQSSTPSAPQTSQAPPIPQIPDSYYNYRTIYFEDGSSFTESENLSFETWKCHEFYSYASNPKTLVEIGIIKELANLGFILYDGTDSGTLTVYSRRGINHRWDWEGDWEGEGGYNYSFVLQPDGTGLFYDFSNVDEGESTNARDVFTCKK